MSQMQWTKHLIDYSWMSLTWTANARAECLYYWGIDYNNSFFFWYHVSWPYWGGVCKDRFNCSLGSKAPLIWSRVTKTTLPWFSLDKLTFPCVALKFKQPFIWMTPSCLTSSGRVTLAGGTTFLHIKTLARLTGTTFGIASVMKCLD